MNVGIKRVYILLNDQETEKNKDFCGVFDCYADALAEVNRRMSHGDSYWDENCPYILVADYVGSSSYKQQVLFAGRKKSLATRLSRSMEAAYKTFKCKVFNVIPDVGE